MSDTLRTATVLRSLPGWGSRPRNGKIARLPLQTRDQINQMLQDGLPYASILDKLAHSAMPPIPYPISEMNLSNWYRGGFQDWLGQRQHEALFRKAGLFPQSEISGVPIAPNLSKSRLVKVKNIFSPVNL